MAIQPPEYDLEQQIEDIGHKTFALDQVKNLHPDVAEAWDELSEILEEWGIAFADINKDEVLAAHLPYYIYAYVYELIETIGTDLMTINLTNPTPEQGRQ